MRVLVTGAGGYLGSGLLGLLRGRAEVTAVDLQVPEGAPLDGVAWHRLDLVDPEAEGRLLSLLAGMDAVVHLAAVVGEPACQADPERAWRVNVEATRTLVALAGRAGVSRFLLASTCGNYGVTAPDALADEDTPLVLTSLYARTKKEAEEAVLGGPVPVPSVFRLASVYGWAPRIGYASVVNGMVLEAVRSRRVRVFAPSAWRPVVHIADAGRAFLQALEAPGERVARQVFNIVGENVQKGQVVEALARLLPGLEVEQVEREDPRSYRVSGEKARQALGFQPRRRLEEGLAEMVARLQEGPAP